jgi:hypothetical protein
MILFNAFPKLLVSDVRVYNIRLGPSVSYYSTYHPTMFLIFRTYLHRMVQDIVNSNCLCYSLTLELLYID